MPARKFLFTLFVSALAFAAGLVFQHGSYSPVASSLATSLPATTPPSGRPLPDFSSLVDKAGPAVVNISVVRDVRPVAGTPRAEPGDPMFEFFRRFQIPAPQAGPQQGVGSGFIISADGYVLTNAHVIADAREVEVRLTDKREFKAKVIGVDRRTDIALIKIDGSGLPTVRIGDSSRTRVGEWVAAIGSPFGFENSVTAGIVSAKSRVLPDESFVPFLQTDVAVNPGNSGGPLLNVNGEVIGINSQIYSRTGGYMGLSFAIPIEVAMKIKDDLQQFGKVSRGRLGVTVQPVSRELAASFGLDNARGALVNSVEPGSPAAQAGIAQGDVIVGINGQAVEQPADLARAVGDARPGQTVAVKIWRKGGTRELSARLAEAAPERAAADAAIPSGKLGLTVRPLTNDERKQLATNGVMVERADGAAARAGIAPGDVILALNNEPVSSVEQLRRLSEQNSGSLALLVQRDNRRIYVPLKLG